MHEDKEFGLLRRLLISNHAILILVFIILGSIAAVAAFLFEDQMFKTLALSIAVAFITATVVDFAYNYVVMKDVEKMVSKHLMLSKEIQEEIMKREKIDEILSTALEKMVGQKLAYALKKSIIDKIAAEKDLFLMEGAYYSSFLKKFTDASLVDFFEISIVSKFNMTLESDDIIFYATDSDKIYQQLIKKEDDPSVYFIYFLPEGCGKMLKSNPAIIDKVFNISEIFIESKDIGKIPNPEVLYDDNENVTIKIKLNIPKEIAVKKGNLVRVHYAIKTLLNKHEHFLFRSIPRAYPSLYMSWNCTQTDIENVEVITSFLGTQPEIVRLSEDGKTIDIIVTDWVLPQNIIVFIWKLKDEQK